MNSNSTQPLGPHGGYYGSATNWNESLKEYDKMRRSAAVPVIKPPEIHTYAKQAEAEHKRSMKMWKVPKVPQDEREQDMARRRALQARRESGFKVGEQYTPPPPPPRRYDHDYDIVTGELVPGAVEEKPVPRQRIYEHASVNMRPTDVLNIRNDNSES